MGLPKHVKRFVLEEVRALEDYKRELEFRMRRIEEIEQEMDAVIYPDRSFEYDRVQGGKPKDPAQLKALYLQEELELHRERYRIVARKIRILTDAMSILDPDKEQILRWAAQRERDRPPAWQMAEKYSVCEKTLYRWYIEAVEKMAPLLVGVFGQ